MLQRRAFSRIFNLLLIGLIVLILHAAAAEEVLPDITIACRPDSVIGPAEITLTITVENRTGNDCENLYISTADGLTSEPLGSLADGEDAVFTRRHSVTEQELEAGKISYIFSYDDPAEPERKVNFIIDTAISRAESRAECEFTRRVSSDTVAPGGTVTVLYTVRNTGNVSVESLHVTDSLGEFSGRIESLAPGESRSLVNRAVLTQPDVSDAQLTFETADGTQTIHPDPRKIGISGAAQTAVLRVERDPDDPYHCIGVLMIGNTGDTDYTNLTVTDDFTGTVIAEGITLNAGENRTVTYTFSYRSDADVRWRIVADSSDGTKIDLMTDTVRPDAAEPADLADVAFSAEALTPRLKRSGNARFRLTVENRGDANVRDLHITEASLGELASFAFVAAGGTVTKDITIAVNGSSEFNFSLNYTDEDSWPNSTSAEPVSVTIAADGVAPENDVPDQTDFSGGSIRIGGSYAFAILMIIGVIALIVLTVVWIVLSHRARIRRHVRLALQKQNKGKK